MSAREAEIRSATGGGAAEPEISAPVEGAGGLAAAVESLPALMARKQTLEQHTAILGAAMKIIMAREIPTLCKEEEGAIKAGRVERSRLVRLMAGSGSVRDRLRLLRVAPRDRRDRRRPQGCGGGAGRVREGDDDAVAAPGGRGRLRGGVDEIRGGVFLPAAARTRAWRRGGGTAGRGRGRRATAPSRRPAQGRANAVRRQASDYLAAAAAAKTYPGQKMLRSVRPSTPAARRPPGGSGRAGPGDRRVPAARPRPARALGGTAFGTAILFHGDVPGAPGR